MAVAEIYIKNEQNSRWLGFVNTVLAPLWYSLKQWFAVFLITVGTLYASVLFSAQHEIFPLYIAIPIAIGITWTYLSGLAYATAIHNKSIWTTPMIISGALTDGLFGMLYVLGKYKIIPEKPDPTDALLLASAHIIPLIVLLVIFTYCKRNYLVEHAAHVKEERDRARAIEDDKLDYERKIRDAKLELTLARERLKLEALVKPNDEKTCDKCHMPLSQAKYGAMKRYGYCSNCKPNDA